MYCAEDTGKQKRKRERGGREERKTAQPDTGVLETGMTSQTDAGEIDDGAARDERGSKRPLGGRSSHVASPH